MFCPQCGKESSTQANFCSACGAAALPTPTQRSQAPVVRPRHPRMIAGVCSGFAIRYGWDLGMVRILFVVITVLTSGAGILFYAAAWIILPEALYALPPAAQYNSSARNMNQYPNA